MSFTEIIVSKLGTPPDPFGWSDALIIGLALLLVVGLEWLLGAAIAQLVRTVWRLAGLGSERPK
jgi:hypothetical protein